MACKGEHALWRPLLSGKSIVAYCCSNVYEIWYAPVIADIFQIGFNYPRPPRSRPFCIFPVSLANSNF